MTTSASGGTQAYDSVAGNKGADPIALTNIHNTTFTVPTTPVYSQTLRVDGYRAFTIHTSSYGGTTYIGQTMNWFVQFSADGTTFTDLRKIDGRDTYAASSILIAGAMGLTTTGPSTAVVSNSYVFPIVANYMRIKVVPGSTVAAGNPYVVTHAYISLLTSPRK